MRVDMKMNIRKIKSDRARLLLSVLLIIFTISNMLFTAHEMHHECSGEDCPICFVIQTSAQNLKLLSFVLSLFFIERIFKHTQKNKSVTFAKSVLESTTLVSQKIRLND